MARAWHAPPTLPTRVGLRCHRDPAAPALMVLDPASATAALSAMVEASPLAAMGASFGAGAFLARVTAEASTADAAELAAALARIAELEAKLESTESQVKELLASTEKNKAKAKADADALILQVRELKEKLGDTMDAYEKQQSQLRDSEGENSKLQRRLEQLETDLVGYKELKEADAVNPFSRFMRFVSGES
eukprot:CAMPEP_0119407022 /NCGR_PEP_ID=MMETSP1335-20130426/1106_1 /TAXON_ID=259385 /ORGANISM="Chrysoculter rhomboideus, Strain RCC1486" /LENGTH=191 /DNA_ID=CAMNT_0007431115 /DNA_START=17 /DNA_END=592 /DNA_ORIENTATION=-